QGYIEGCWGDGIYIGTGTQHYCENVHIERTVCYNNRRQGISVTSVKGLDLLDCILSSTNGTLPASGLDIEPNNPESHLEGVNIVNLKTINNEMQGVLIALRNMAHSGKVVDINIINHRDYNSKAGALSFYESEGGFEGVISISSSTYKGGDLQSIL